MKCIFQDPKSLGPFLQGHFAGIKPPLYSGWLFCLWVHCSLCHQCLEISLSGWMTHLSRGVSVSYCCDDAAKQATPKFIGYKNKHLFSCLCVCLKVLGLVPGFFGLSQIYSPFLHILPEIPAIRGMLFL